ncbi:SDR family NAD(P)-dependent oxidoreductase [Dyadobacter psychrotolerans]|uniref:SDR family NAD(P)-dependent oxidoreductase n=1 Tax=Dyadobacter psychrotolerans TaxID=2541721 RepID=UPI0014043492|nr:SDR family NAD(P)-dependent oxidoreductase [Dyadobacter psychrotolerans]
MKSVRSFADRIKQRLRNIKIDVLVLNAGIRAANNQVSSQEGFELTFATNHLSHYLLARLFEPNLTEGGRIIITTSDAHDPAVIPFGPKTLNIESSGIQPSIVQKK